MKTRQFLHINLLLLAFACSEEKFTERNFQANSLEESGDLDAQNDTNGGPIVVEVDDKAKGVSPEEGTLEDGGSCATETGVAADRVKISGSEQVQKISSSDVFAAKITGNQNKLQLELKGADINTKLPGVCLFLAGNQNDAEVRVSLQLGTVYIRARGNQPHILLQVDKDAAIGAINVDAAGNQAQISIKGEGKYPCAAQNNKGKALAVNCEKAP